jgi:hypothetical protein
MSPDRLGNDVAPADKHVRAGQGRLDRRSRFLRPTNALAIRRLLLPMRDRAKRPAKRPAKDAGILALKHQLAVLERQQYGQKVRLAPADRAFSPRCSTDSPRRPTPHPAARTPETV